MNKIKINFEILKKYFPGIVDIEPGVSDIVMGICCRIDPEKKQRLDELISELETEKKPDFDIIYFVYSYIQFIRPFQKKSDKEHTDFQRFLKEFDESESFIHQPCDFTEIILKCGKDKRVIKQEGELLLYSQIIKLCDLEGKPRLMWVRYIAELKKSGKFDEVVKKSGGRPESYFGLSLHTVMSYLYRYLMETTNMNDRRIKIFIGKVLVCCNLLDKSIQEGATYSSYDDYLFKRVNKMLK